jgi:uncharacterized lipoprotein
MKKISVLSVLLVLGVTGCSTLSSVKVASSHIVDKYCGAPEKIRKIIRTEVGSVVHPNAITVVCSADKSE